MIKNRNRIRIIDKNETEKDNTSAPATVHQANFRSSDPDPQSGQEPEPDPDPKHDQEPDPDP